ncbi:MAG: iron-sulfur cluster assembly protein [Pseudomonadota bacterium]
MSSGVLDARLKKTMTPDDGLSLKDFMPAMGMEEPDWVHVKTQQNADRAVQPDVIRDAVIDNLSLILDPEIPVNIYELGLIYSVDVSDTGDVVIEMTLTAPNCPVADAMPEIVKRGALQVPGTKSCTVDLTWEPPWSIDKASEDARLALGY